MIRPKNWKLIAVVLMLLGVFVADFSAFAAGPPNVVCDGQTCRVVSPPVVVSWSSGIAAESLQVTAPQPVQESPLVPIADPSIGGVYVSYSSAPVVGSVMSDGGIVTSVSYSEHVSQPHTYTTRRIERIQSRGRWFPGKGFVRWLRR